MYLLWIIGIIILNQLAALFAERRAKKELPMPYKALPDIIQENLPILYIHTPDYLLLYSLIFCFIYNYTFSIDYEIHIKSLLYSLTIRPIFICVTTLPSCMKTENIKKTWYTDMFICTHDLMFSGHTCVFIFCGKIIGGMIGYFIQFILPVSLIMARQHYTIDVLTAMFIYNFFYQYNI